MNTLRCLSTFFSARRSSDSTYSRYSMSSTISTYSRFSIYISPSGQSITKHTHLTVTVHEVLRQLFFLSSGEPPTRCILMSNNFTYVIAGGHISCNQCQAMSKRSRQRCKAPAIKGKRVCKTHGGRSTGPKTEAGRLRCSQAKTTHGRETRETRTERSLDSARLAVLEAVGFSIGLMSGDRTRGRRSERMAEVYPELQALLELRPYSSGVVKQRFK
jgi:hypothetical protein